MDPPQSVGERRDAGRCRLGVVVQRSGEGVDLVLGAEECRCRFSGLRVESVELGEQLVVVYLKYKIHC